MILEEQSILEVSNLYKSVPNDILDDDPEWIPPHSTNASENEEPVADDSSPFIQVLLPESSAENAPQNNLNIGSIKKQRKRKRHSDKSEWLDLKNERLVNVEKVISDGKDGRMTKENEMKEKWVHHVRRKALKIKVEKLPKYR